MPKTKSKQNKIDIKQEDVDKLIEIGVKMNTQDNRSTAYPLFVIQSLNKVYSENGCESERNEDIDDNELCKSCKELYDNEKDLPEQCEECDSCGFHWFDNEYEFDLRAGVFFTEQACEEHIKANDYHYTKPRSYAIGAWRNEEMQEVMRIISSLGSKDGKVTNPYL